MSARFFSEHKLCKTTLISFNNEFDKVKLEMYMVGPERSLIVHSSALEALLSVIIVGESKLNSEFSNQGLLLTISQTKYRIKPMICSNEGT